MNPNRYVRIVSMLATSLAVLGACFVASAETIPLNGQGLPAGAVFNPETRTFTWTPTAAQVGQHQVTFWVTDGIDTDSETITITVLPSGVHSDHVDLDGDGNADLLLQSRSGLVRGQRLDGSGGSVGGLDSVDVGEYGVQLLGMADVNGDGVVDFIVKLLDESNSYQIRFRDSDGNVVGRITHRQSDVAWQVVTSYDMNKDGNADFIWQNVDTGAIAVWYLNSSGNRTSSSIIVSKMADWRLVGVGDFDNDGNMDLFWSTVSGDKSSVAVWLLNADGVAKPNGKKSVGSASLSWRCVGSADYNNDGWLDLVWQNETDGSIYAWLLDGQLKRMGSLRLHNGSSGCLYASWVWDIQMSGPKPWDSDGDGNADLFWRHKTDGRIAVWYYNGMMKRLSTKVVVEKDAPGKLIARADMDNDGIQDYVWAQEIETETYVHVWLLNADGSQKQAYIAGSAPIVWKLCGVGDMNSDGNDDLIWQDSASGRVAVWHMDGSGSRLSAATIVSRMDNWRVHDVTDMDGDGKADLIWVWKKDSGKVYVSVWFMDGNGAQLSSVVVGSASLPWNYGCASDYNNDGNMDIVWYNTDNGQASYWLLDPNMVRISTGSFGTGGSDWELRW